MLVRAASWRLQPSFAALLLTLSCSAAEGGATTSLGGGVDNGEAGDSGGSGAPSPASDNDDRDCARDGDGRTTLVFVNGCRAPITFRGSDIEGGMLAVGATRCVDIGSDVEPIASKRYWGFRGADPGAEHHTLAEFTFNTDFHDFDWYNISHVDAFNLPSQITPLARPDCKVLTCAHDLVPDCPAEGRFEDAQGELVACVSPDRDDPMSPVATYFESCDDAYAWSGDDQLGDDPSPMRACAGEDWQISFCPERP
jgi:hypothetical protein